jgi:hypothetical protein
MYTKRVNQDFIINSHGKNLLDLCLSSGLRILNWRFTGLLYLHVK